MVYIKNGKVKGFTKKVALPLALAASAFTPVMAETTLKVVGPEGNKIAYDETKQVAINMTSEGDNVSFVEVNIELPKGLQYVQGSFKKADIEALKGHQYKVTLTPKGFHVAIYSDNLDSMGDMTDTTIGTFDVKANTALTGEDNIAMTIVDLTDDQAEQIPYNNEGLDGDEGADGDNSIGSEPISIDKQILPGEWKVTATAAALADGVLPFNPLFDAQTISIELENNIAQVAGMEFRLILPQGLTLDEESLALTDRKEDQTVGKQIIVNKETSEETNDYKIFILGGDKGFKGSEGAILTFDLNADMTFAVDPEADFKDEILFENIIVTDIYANAIPHEDITMTVQNLNEKAHFELGNKIAEVEAQAAEEPYTRVYDYEGVVEKRDAANEKYDEYYQAGTLDVNKEEVSGLIADYLAEIEADTEKNEEIYNELLFGEDNEDIKSVKELRDELEAADQPQYPAEEAGEAADGARAMAAAGEEEPIAGEGEEVNPYKEAQIEGATEMLNNLKALDEKRVAAIEAIDAFEARIQELYDQQENDPNADRYDGALLTAEEEMKELGEAAEQALEDFIAKRDEVNDANKAIFDGLFDKADEYIDGLTAETNDAENGPYVNDYKEVTPVKEALEAAQAALDEQYDAIALPYVEGLSAVVRAIQDAVKAAEDAKAKNDAFQAALGGALADAKEALQDAKDKLQETLDDEKYNYIETSEIPDGNSSAQQIAAINEKIEEIEDRIAEVEEAINNDFYPNDDVKDQDAEEEVVNGFLDTLDEILGDIDGVLNEETGELEDGLDQDIENAIATYDKYHMRGDANMDGRVSMIDYNLIMQYVREEKDINDVPEEDNKRAEQLSQLNVVQEKSFGTDIEINITDAVGALKIYLNDGSDEGLKLGDRYYSARATDAERLVASSQLVNGMKRIALSLSNASEYTAAQFDVVLPEGMKIAGAQLGERTSGHQLFVGNVKDGRQRVIISSSELKAFAGSEGAVVYIDVEGAGEVEFSNVLFATTDAESVLFSVENGTTGIAGAKTAAEGEKVFDLGGRVMNALKKGVNIIRRADGSSQKVIKK